MADWSGSDYAVIIASVTSSVVTLVGLWRLGRNVDGVVKKIDGILDARVAAAEDSGDLRGRRDQRAEQVVRVEAVRTNAVADAQSQADVRSIEAGETKARG